MCGVPECGWRSRGEWKSGVDGRGPGAKGGRKGLNGDVLGPRPSRFTPYTYMYVGESYVGGGGMYGTDGYVEEGSCVGEGRYVEREVFMGEARCVGGSMYVCMEEERYVRREIRVGERRHVG